MKRLELLDYGRFFASFIVVFFHYFYNGIQNGKINSITHIPVWSALCEYGHFGVPFFFMISGYVIFFSIHNKSASDFLIARCIRLYPLYWLGLLFTTSFILIWGSVNGFSVTLKEFLVNITMLQDLVHIKNIDGVYWTLIYELKFYFVVFALMLFLSENRIHQAFRLWPLAIIASVILHKKLLVFNIDYCYFSLGVSFGMLKLNQYKINYLVLGGNALLCFYHMYRTQSGDAYIVGTVFVALCIIYFFILNMKRVASWQLPYSDALGKMTYPLYLVHAYFGYMFLSKFATEQNKFILYPLLILIVCLVSYVLSTYVDPKLKTVSRVLFTKLISPVVYLEKKVFRC